MMHRRHPGTARLALAVALTIGGVGVALAARDSGDSSMNPFTGESYAYFHGGRNLGEGAMIRPGGTPPPQGFRLYPPRERASVQRAPDAQTQPVPVDPARKSARAPTADGQP